MVPGNEQRSEPAGRRSKSPAVSSRRLDAYVRRARQAPRLTGMFGEFSRLATGAKGAPDAPVVLSRDLLQNDALCLRYSKVRDRYASTFNQHFVASLPYVLEEQCRFGAGILAYSQYLAGRENRPMDVYTLGDASGVTARALTDMGDGRIRTLTCSPNPENETAFLRDKPKGEAHFFLGPFFEVTKSALRDRGIHAFDAGFDLVVEDTTFQMYGSERLEPVCLAARNLRADGIFVLLEKFMHPDEGEFIRRERQKDEGFKGRYFPPGAIEDKKQTIVTEMDSLLVTLDEMTSSLGRLFRHAAITWNSGNFYTIAASDNGEKLAHFVNALIPPAIPAEFLHEELPRRILGDPGTPLEFRRPKAG